MKAEYDFSKAKKNPYAKKLKKQITINIATEAVRKLGFGSIFRLF